MKIVGKRLIFTALLLAMLLPSLAGCSSPRTRHVMTVNGEGVQAADVMVHLFFAKQNYFQSSIEEGSVTLASLVNLSEYQLTYEIAQGTTLGDYLLSTAASTATNFIICRQQARKEKIRLTSADKETIQGYKKQLIADLGGANAYNNFLKAAGTTEDALMRYYKDVVYTSKLSKLYQDGEKYALTDEETKAVQKEYSDKYVTVRQIMLLKVDNLTMASLSEAEIAQKRHTAELALERIRNGEGFDLVKKELSDYPDDERLTFTSGTYNSAFEQAAFALKIGEVSELVTTDIGFHVIIRDKLSQDKFAQCYANAISQKFYNDLTKWTNAAKITTRPAFADLAAV